jgi:glyoxylase I family protein
LIIKDLHHIAIICSDYQRSKSFYCDVLRLTILNETWLEERKGYKLDLALNGRYLIELFSFPNPPPRLSRPEAAGLRHLAFEVDSLDLAIGFRNAPLRSHLRSRSPLIPKPSK